MKRNYSTMVLALFFIGINMDVLPQCTPFTSVSFNISTDTVCPGESISFSSYTTSDEVAWDFGDGSTSTYRYPSKAYDNPGTYNVTLTLTKNCGQDTSVTKQVYVGSDLPYKPSNGNFIQWDVENDTVCPGELIDFVCYENISSMKWNLGDGNSSTSKYLYDYRYFEPGVYYVKLTVYNYCGSAATVRDTIVVKNNLPFKSTGSVTVSKTSVCPGEEISFSAPAGLNSYLWDMGDGTKFINRSGNYKYASSGNFNAKVTMTNHCGSDTTFSKTIQVNANQPYNGPVSFTVSPSTACPNEGVDFYPSSSSAKTYTWTFGDGNSSSSKSINDKIYYTPGNYNVQLKVTDYCNNDTVIIRPVAISGDIKITGSSNISISSTQLCPGEPVDIHCYRSSRNYTWNFGNGNVSTNQYNYDLIYFNGSQSFYPIELTISNGCGNDSTYYDTLEIVNNRKTENVTLSINPKSVCIGEPVSFSSNYYSFKAKSVLWNFGDGNTSSEPYVYDRKYNLPGQYPITFKVTSYCNIAEIYKDTVNIYTDKGFGEDVTLSIPDFPVCPNENLSFSVNYYNATSYYWTFGDGGTSNKSYANHTYKNAGKYPVKLRMTNYCGRDTTIVDTILVKSNIPINTAGLYVSIEPKSVCPNDKVSFNASGGGTEFLWNFGDGNSENNGYTNHIYEYTGYFPVKLTILNGCGYSVSLNDTIKVIGNKSITDNPSLYINPKEACPDEGIYFSVSGEYYQYLWNFGDGTYSIDRYPPRHPYDSAGNYTIALKLTNGCGLSKTVYDSVKILSNLPYRGSVDFYHTASDICPGEEVYFNASQNAVLYLWNFDDGNISRERYADHVFSESGFYNVGLTMKNGCGFDTTIYKTIEIESNVKINPTVNIQVSPDNTVCLGDVVSFRVNNNYSDNIQWSFGDGVKDNKSVVTHSYSIPANFSVTAKVINGCGFDTTLTTVIRVKNNIKPDIDDYTGYPSTSRVCPNDTIYFINQPAGNKYTWYYGDGTSQSEHNLIMYSLEDGAAGPGGTKNAMSVYKHAYKNAGNFDAYFVVTNGCGYSDTSKPRTITVTSGLSTQEPSFYWDNNKQYADSLIIFYAYGASNYSWNFGDGSPNVNTYGTESYIYHTFNTPGKYNVRMTTSNGCGQTKEVSRNLTILDINQGIGFMEDAICQGDTLLFFGNPLTKDGKYVKVLDDSLVIQQLKVFSIFNDTIDYDFCEGDFVIINGTAYDIPSLASGVFPTDTFTNANGCDSIVIYNLTYDYEAYNEPICLVTVDLETGKNMVVWEKSPNKRIAEYYLLRESNIANIYDTIARLPYAKGGVYVDLTSNPESQQHLYKLLTIDECFNKSDVSTNPFHQTMLLQYAGSAGGINLSWSNQYRVNGIPYAFDSYIIYRGSDSTSLKALDTVSGSLYAFIDTSNAAFTKKFYYRIAGISSLVCDPNNLLKASSGPFSQSVSNLEDNRLKEESTPDTTDGNASAEELANFEALITVAPNPYSGSTTIYYSIEHQAQVEIFFTNMLSQKIYSPVNRVFAPGAYSLRFSARELGYPSGMYFMNVVINGKTHVKKLVEQE